ncbi:thioesterase family protein [Ammoniphilus sp. YIM 78166]|uniref:acyl-CoA thioesterase n=1 Tax=Ammoniphilus sp. YIM 78166 TaxID=1644106 RepID=UPI00106FA025|nr:thioesterase family protein [Ammoniphilus sp. YIM 78166]
MRQNEFQLVVNFGDTDMAGIVYYPNYFKWFDIASHQLFRTMGLPMAQLDEHEQIILPLIDVRCSFEKPLKYDDIITIKTVVAEIKTKTIRFEHEVYRGETRTGHGYEIRGWVKRFEHGIQAVPIPDGVRELLMSDRPVETQKNPWLSA